MWFRVLVGLVAFVLIMRVGLGLIRGFARPAPAPPPEGEMRRVKIVYRCSSCGLEIRTTKSPSEDPEPPRHCMEDMDVVQAVDL